MFSGLFFSAVRAASGRPEVRNARDAIDAYKNITDAINAAEAAANDAKTAADRALNVSQRSKACFSIFKWQWRRWVHNNPFLSQNVKGQRLTDRAKDLKDNSIDLLNEAERNDKELKSKIGLLLLMQLES